MQHYSIGQGSPLPQDEGTSSPPWWATYAGPGLSALPVLVLLFDGCMKIGHMVPELATWQIRTGLPVSLMTSIGIAELVCVALYVIPRTAVLGAVLLTAFLGGGVAGQLRVGGASATAALGLAVCVWAALYLRDPRIRALLPVVKDLES